MHFLSVIYIMKKSAVADLFNFARRKFFNLLDRKTASLNIMIVRHYYNKNGLKIKLLFFYVMLLH
jgi:hypothetical protein